MHHDPPLLLLELDFQTKTIHHLEKHNSRIEQRLQSAVNKKTEIGSLPRPNGHAFALQNSKEKQKYMVTRLTTQPISIAALLRNAFRKRS